MKENNAAQTTLENSFKDIWGISMDEVIAFWRKWQSASEYQKDVFSNYADVFGGMDFIRPFLQLAPNRLFQEINPWSFSLIQFTRQIKGSPDVESRILTDVAGYGSQLGTIMDFLDILSKEVYPEARSRNLSDEDDLKYLKYRDLSEKIRKIKEK